MTPILTVDQLFHGFPLCSCIDIYCDNQGVLDQIDWLRERQYFQDAITTNDYHIYMEIQYILDLLHPMVPTFHHMKGHQDENL